MRNSPIPLESPLTDTENQLLQDVAATASLLLVPWMTALDDREQGKAHKPGQWMAGLCFMRTTHANHLGITSKPLHD